MKKLIVIISLLAGCTQQTAPPQGAPKVPVNTAVAIKEDIPIILSTMGNVYARITVQLRPQVEGRILETHVQQGQYVKKGDLLYTIDPRTYRANVDKAKAILDRDEAQLVFAKQKLERYSQLLEKEYVSPLTLEELTSNVEALKAQIIGDKADLDLAKYNLERCFVFSPIDGKISQFEIDVGNLVKAYDENALTEILQIKPVEVRFAFPQKDFLEIKKYFTTDKLDFFVFEPNHLEHEFTGVVDFIDNKIDMDTGTILLKGVVNNPEELLWPGAFVWVKVLLKTEKNVITVPREAVQIGQQGPFVFAIDKDLKADLRKVTLGAEYEDKIIILSGVLEGETVVTNGQLNLRPGSEVYIKVENNP